MSAPNVAKALEDHGAANVRESAASVELIAADFAKACDEHAEAVGLDALMRALRARRVKVADMPKEKAPGAA